MTYVLVLVFTCFYNLLSVHCGLCQTGFLNFKMIMNFFWKYIYIVLFFAFTIAEAQQKETNGLEQRRYFVQMLTKIARPVLYAVANDSLKIKMPIETAPNAYGDRDKVTHLEAFGRTLSGIAAWLQLGSGNSTEGKLREEYIKLAVAGITNAVNPKAKDYMNFTEGGQPLVDAAFLAQGLLRAPVLWERLDSETRFNVISALKSTRNISPAYMNWLLFTGIVEAALLKYEGKADMVRIEYALLKHNEWYLGDGTYGDGKDFHWDYYNSYVIQPMMLDVINVLKEKEEQLKNWRYKNDFINQSGKFYDRAKRYAAIQERLISPEGTYPAFGRSLAYRVGAFQSLAQMAYFQKLPDNVSAAQVRCALYSIIKKQMEAPGTFTDTNWLTIGFYGHQPEIGEPYISTGSLYLCTEAFLPLGLPEQTPFWQAPDELYTQQKIWSGQKSFIDYAYYDQSAIDKRKWETVLDSSSFANSKKFSQEWNLFYPWGTDHNGTARMYKDQIAIDKGVLKLTAEPVKKKEGKSTSKPNYEINFHSGAIHAKHQITVSKEYPVYRVSGEFKAPIKKGTWPAFWLTAVKGWPPEIDILEFKGDANNWQNTFITPQNCTTIKENIPNASNEWHQYSVELKYVDEIHTQVSYFLDGEKMGDHWTDFTNKAMWLIINLQMEGSSGTVETSENVSYLSKNVIIKRLSKL